MEPSTGNLDEESLVSRMFDHMSAGGTLPQGIVIDQAYPFLKAMITSNSARRQNVNEEAQDNIESIGGLFALMTALEEDKRADEKELTLEQEKGIEKMRTENPNIAEELASASAKKNQTMMVPPGISIDEDSRSLARRLELSSVAIEKLPASTKSFGMIQTNDDITLPEADLVTIGKSRGSFGLIQPKEIDDPKTQRDHVEQFLEMTAHLSPEDRMKLLIDTSGKTAHEDSDEEGQEADRDMMNSLSDGLVELWQSLEPLHLELSDIHEEIKMMMMKAKIPHSEKIGYADEMMGRAQDIEGQLAMTLNVSKHIGKVPNTPVRTKNFNIASFANMEVQRRPMLEGNEGPRLPPPRKGRWTTQLSIWTRGLMCHPCFA